MSSTAWKTIGNVLPHSYKVTLGISFALVAALFESVAVVMPKPLIDETLTATPVNPIVFVFVVYLLNGIIFTPSIKKREPFRKLGSKLIVLLTIIGVIEVASTLFTFYGVKDTSGTSASLLGNSEIIFGVLIAMVFLRERLYRREAIPFFMIISGAVLLPILEDMEFGAAGLTKFVVGDLYLLIASLFLGIVTCLYKYTSQNIDVKRIIQYTSFVGALVALTLIVSFQIPFEIESSALPGIFIIGILGIGLPTMFFVMALKYIGAIRTTLIFSSITVFGIMLSNLFLRESLMPLDILSLLLIIGGTIIMRKKISK